MLWARGIGEWVYCSFPEWLAAQIQIVLLRELSISRVSSSSSSSRRSSICCCSNRTRGKLSQFFRGILTPTWATSSCICYVAVYIWINLYPKLTTCLYLYLPVTISNFFYLSVYVCNHLYLPPVTVCIYLKVPLFTCFILCQLHLTNCIYYSPLYTCRLI